LSTWWVALISEKRDNMNTITYLKEVKKIHTQEDEKTLHHMANIIDEYVELVCQTRYKVFKSSIHQMLRTDIAIKAMTEQENEKAFFLGKENAFRQINKLVEDIENADFNDLLTKVNHRFAEKS
jgi:hypothetical protein